MGTGRTLPIYERLYVNGFDISGNTIDTGERGVDHNPTSVLTLTDTITGYYNHRPTVTVGPINGVFDNTVTTGLHIIASAAQGTRMNTVVVQGIRAVPAMGDDAFCAPMLLSSYKAKGDPIVTATLKLDGIDATAGINYREFFGKLLHPLGSETAANTSNTNVDNGAATAAGGWLMWMITSITGTGTVTLSIDDSANGTSWAALSGATTAAIATATAPTSGFIQLATTAAVREYLRPQIAFGGSATAASYLLAFMRGR